MKGSSVASEGYGYLGTARGQGGVSVVHLVGDSAIQVLVRCFVPRRGVPHPRPESSVSTGKLAFGRIEDRGELLDEVIVRYPGPDQAEVCLHGGPVGVERFTELLAREGVALVGEREAALREWDRAGRDTLRFEVLQALKGGAGARGIRLLGGFLKGRLHEAVDRAVRSATAEDLASRMGALLGEWERIRRTLIPVRAVLIGPTNAGKSTLFNRLLGTDRVVVADEPGTTRDAIEVEVPLDGLTLRLIDTAGFFEPGLRSSSGLDPDDIALERTRRAVRKAQLILLVLDEATGLDEVPEWARELVQGQRRIVVWNKIDLGSGLRNPRIPSLGEGRRHDLGEPLEPPIRLSARTGEGVEVLVRRISETILASPGRAPDGASPGEPGFFTSRQRRAAEALVASAKTESNPSADRDRWVSELRHGPPDLEDPIFSGGRSGAAGAESRGALSPSDL